MHRDELIARIAAHREWIQSAGEQGNQMDLDNFDLTAINLTTFPFEQSFLTECRLTSHRFEGVDFFESEFYSCDFTDAWFVGCSFRKATLGYCNFRRAHFVRCEFPRAEVYQSCFAECCFEECSFVGISLMECDLSGTSLVDTDWDGAYLDQIIFRGAHGNTAKNINALVHAKISADPEMDGWLEGTEALLLLNKHI